MSVFTFSMINSSVKGVVQIAMCCSACFCFVSPFMCPYELPSEIVNLTGQKLCLLFIGISKSNKMSGYQQMFRSVIHDNERRLTLGLKSNR